ncbi:MAG: hypothetical protein KKA07_18745 [Bacteroidetes bacterium]|nr:hypothetical protein [Bacteroidota bacterium]MBU1721111.1 hypothetical protein [Bacteroidota bacterium]
MKALREKNKSRLFLLMTCLFFQSLYMFGQHDSSDYKRTAKNYCQTATFVEDLFFSSGYNDACYFNTSE